MLDAFNITWQDSRASVYRAAGSVEVLDERLNLNCAVDFWLQLCPLTAVSQLYAILLSALLSVISFCNLM